MANITIPDLAQSAGIPSTGEDVITSAQVALITGHEPAVLTVDEIVAASQNIPALTPVGFNADDEVVPAVIGSADPADDVAAIGITVIAVVTGATGPKKGAPIYRGGCFNPDALNWPAGFDTDAEKFAAFKGAPTPTNIILRRPKTASV